jgi:hypothetical protein
MPAFPGIQIVNSIPKKSVSGNTLENNMLENEKTLGFPFFKVTASG